MPGSEWTRERLTDRFERVGKDVERLEHDLRIVLPLVGQVGGLEADIEDALDALKELRTDLKDLSKDVREHEIQAERTANDVIRAGRAENLKLIGVVLGAFTTFAAAIIGLFASGTIG